MKILYLIIIILSLTVSVYGQKVVTFKYTACAGDDAEVKEPHVQLIERSGNTTKIKMTAFANCAGKFNSTVRVVNDSTIDLQIKVKPTIYKNRKGEPYELLEEAECDCIFDFDYELIGITAVNSKIILVNGRTFDDMKEFYQIIYNR